MCRRSDEAATSSWPDGVIIRRGTCMHVYRSGRLVVKWDLENRKAMKGKAASRVIALIEKLEAEGRL